MSADPKPTNEQIVALLQRVLVEIEALKDGQRQIAAELQSLANERSR